MQLFNSSISLKCFATSFFMALFIASPILSNARISEKHSNIIDIISNGAIAFAYPMSNIKIDGDTSDWPKNLTKYSINKLPYGRGPKDQNDFNAYFHVGYNTSEQSLYILVIVTDDSYVVDTSEESDWNTQDTFNFYVDLEHSPDGSGIDLYQYGENYKDTNNQSISWDPSKTKTNWNNIEIVSKRKGTTTIYECKVKGNNKLAVNKTIGIDYVFIDKDVDDAEGDNSFIAWGNGGGKSSGPGRLGDVILMKEKKNSATITGQLRWKNDTLKKFPNKIRFTNIDHPMLWTQVVIDSIGNYKTELPFGEYSVSLANSIIYLDRDIIKINKENVETKITVDAKTKKESYDLELVKKANPNLIGEKGILKDFDPQKPEAIDNFIKTYQDYYEIPGVSLALIKNGKMMYHKTYGVKNTFTKEEVDENTLFEAASITKPVFGFAVMRLVERGLIDLDKPLHQYLPFEEIAHDERYQLITARHVLTHKTGFPNWAYMNEDGKIDIKFTPGTKYGYSGEGFEYLKRVVAHITQKDINDLLKDEVLLPLGLENTYFSKNDYLAKVVANGHFDSMPTQVSLPEEPGMAWSMHTEAKAFSNFLLGLSDKKGLKSETYKELFTTQTEIPKGDNDPVPDEYKNYFGLSISIQKSPFGLAFGHGGNNGDFKCLALMYQDLDMGFVVFTNSNTGDQLNDDLVEYLITGKRSKNK
ncbi:serine hydrolase [Aquimarina celericrescens]|uniref:Serine hydrolase n=1 Tax=Aquimarina celericrescens TaxID=1964542 RepID=A0ABW5AS88_9FLAO|nr:serine hydrolase [Aquimarina celericrescens]